MRRKTIIIGWFLIGLMFVAFFVFLAILIIQGAGSIPISSWKSGKPSSLIPVAYIPVFMVAVVVGIVYVAKKLIAYFSGAEKKESFVKKGTEDTIL